MRKLGQDVREFDQKLFDLKNDFDKRCNSLNTNLSLNTRSIVMQETCLGMFWDEARRRK